MMGINPGCLTHASSCLHYSQNCRSNLISGFILGAQNKRAMYSYSVRNAKLKVEITKSSKVKSKTKKQFSAGIFDGGCFLAKNCQHSNRVNQLEPTEVRKMLYSVY